MLTVHCIFIYYCRFNEDKPLYIYIQYLFLKKSEFEQEKPGEKRKIFRNVMGNQQKSDKIIKLFHVLKKFIFCRLSQGIFKFPEFLESCACVKP